jgi:hypothetical protein
MDTWAVGGIVGNWEYWNGGWIPFAGGEFEHLAGDFAQPTITQYPDRYIIRVIPANDWATTALNGITGYWMRFIITAAGFAAPQLSANPYPINAAYLNIDADELQGDIENNIDIIATNTVDTSATYKGLPSHVLVGSRSLSRGEDFSAYISGVTMNPFVAAEWCTQLKGITITGATSPATVNRGASPNNVVLSVTVALPGTPYALITVAFDQSVASQYEGAYRVMARVQQVGGVYGDSTIRIYSNSLGLGTEYKTCPVTLCQLVDFGNFYLPFSQRFSGQHNIYIRMDDTLAAGLSWYFSDLILFPVDEWAGMFTASNYDNTIGRAVGDAGVGCQTLYVNGTFPKNRKYSVGLMTSMDELYLGEYDDIVTNIRPAAISSPVLQSNDDQRLWFLSFCDIGGNYIAYGHEMLAVVLKNNQNYLGMRGAR